MRKSRFAYHFSAETLCETSDNLRMWTFTVADVIDVSEFARRWKNLITALRRAFPDWRGLRVWEWHRATDSFTRGLHAHFLTPGWFDVNLVRPIAERCHFGRINVVNAVSKDAASRYMAKYLGKQQGSAGVPGLRRWAAVGGKEFRATMTRVKDVQILSTFGDIWRWLCSCAEKTRQALVASRVRELNRCAPDDDSVTSRAPFSRREHSLGLAWNTANFRNRIEMVQLLKMEYLSSDSDTFEAWTASESGGCTMRLPITQCPF